jgi:hypothetical protein
VETRRFGTLVEAQTTWFGGGLAGQETMRETDVIVSLLTPMFIYIYIYIYMKLVKNEIEQK